MQDESARRVMAEFYRRRDAHPEQGKAGALRQAQLALRRIGAQGVPTASRSAAPVFAANPPAAGVWAHPYYWAPFVLVGDWR